MIKLTCCVRVFGICVFLITGCASFSPKNHVDWKERERAKALELTRSLAKLDSTEAEVMKTKEKEVLSASNVFFSSFGIQPFVHYSKKIKSNLRHYNGEIDWGGKNWGGTRLEFAYYPLKFSEKTLIGLSYQYFNMANQTSRPPWQFKPKTRECRTDFSFSLGFVALGALPLPNVGGEFSRSCRSISANSEEWKAYRQNKIDHHRNFPELALNTSTFSVSILHFFRRSHLWGPFFRVDQGLGKLTYYKGNPPRGDFHVDTSKEWINRLGVGIISADTGAHFRIAFSIDRTSMTDVSYWSVVCGLSYWQ